MSLCEKNCDYKGYDSEIKKAECECEIKINMPLMSEIVINKEKLMNNLVYIKNIINLKIMKCYKILFSINGLKNNIGSYILLSIIFIIILIFFLFYIKEYKTLFDMINKVVIFKKTNIQNKNENSKNNKKKKIHIKGEIINIKKKNKKNKSKIKSKIIKGNKNILETKGQDINCSFSTSKIGLNKTKVLNKKQNEKKFDLNKNELNTTSNKNIKDNNAIKYNDYELNSLEYKQAIKIDKRTYIQYYLSLLKISHLFIFSFIANNVYFSFLLDYIIM